MWGFRDTADMGKHRNMGKHGKKEEHVGMGTWGHTSIRAHGVRGAHGMRHTSVGTLHGALHGSQHTSPLHATPQRRQYLRYICSPCGCRPSLRLCTSVKSSRIIPSALSRSRSTSAAFCSPFPASSSRSSCVEHGTGMGKGTGTGMGMGSGMGTGTIMGIGMSTGMDTGKDTGTGKGKGTGKGMGMDTRMHMGMLPVPLRHRHSPPAADYPPG